MTPELHVIVDEEHSEEESPAYGAISGDFELVTALRPIVDSLWMSIVAELIESAETSGMSPQEIIRSALAVGLVTGIAIGRRDMGWTP